MRQSASLSCKAKSFYKSSKKTKKGGFSMPSLGIGEKVGSMFSGIGRMFSSSKDTPEKKEKVHAPRAKSALYGQAATSLSYEADSLSSKGTGSGSAVSLLIGLQSFDGSWKLSDEFTQVVGKQAKEFQTKFNFQDASVAATLLAITWLEVKHGDTRDEWSIIADKAVAWLNTSMSLQLQGRGVDEWKQEAKNFI